MIRVEGRALIIPDEERVIGYVDDNKIETREFYVTEAQLFEFSFKLDVESADGRDIIDLAKKQADGGIVLLWEVLWETLQKAGVLHVQLRAFSESGEVWHSEVTDFTVRRSIYDTEGFAKAPLTEFEEIERRATFAKEAAELSASEAEGSANDAKHEAENAEKARELAFQYANNALKSATDAEARARDAKASYEDAKQSEGNAKASEEAASRHSLAALDAESRAQDAVKAAKNSVDFANSEAYRAEDAANRAETAAGRAENAQGEAVLAKEAAEESAQVAKQSELNAESSRIAAKQSELAADARAEYAWDSEQKATEAAEKAAQDAITAGTASETAMDAAEIAKLSETAAITAAEEARAAADRAEAAEVNYEIAVEANGSAFGLGTSERIMFDAGLGARVAIEKTELGVGVTYEADAVESVTENHPYPVTSGGVYAALEEAKEELRGGFEIPVYFGYDASDITEYVEEASIGADTPLRLKFDSHLWGGLAKAKHNGKDVALIDIGVEMGETEVQVANYYPHAVSGKAVREALETTKKDLLENPGDRVANALKGKTSGKSVAISGVSPINHMLKVKAESESLSDISAAKILVQGKNLAVVLEDYDTSGSGKSSTKIAQKAGYFVSVIPVKPNTSYRISKQTNASGRLRCFYYDTEPIIGETNSFDGVYNDSSSRLSITTPENCRYIAVGWGDVYEDFQIEQGAATTEFEPHREPIEYDISADGTVDGIYSEGHSFMTLYSDTEDVTISVEYNRDLNKAFEEIYNAIISLGGNV